MKMTILYDNESQVEGLKADWGFSCLIECHDRNILFDTGTSGKLLLENMKALGVDPESVDEVFISHSHFDHMGGLSTFLGENHEVKIYAPPQIRGIAPAREVIYVDKPMKLSEEVYTTGLLEGIEQSIAIEMEKGLVVVVGCSHPGVGNILDAARAFGTPYALIGGLHGFNQYELLKPLQLVCPTHCTQHISEIKSLYPEKYIGGGVGAVIEI
jgi:7,8-dihydropterin-6-yl-methyl-4-(beta-D-ribofuranosyl)aminobenzene 5'-phosphate synthase